MKFSEDTWVGDVKFRVIFKRLYELKVKGSVVEERLDLRDGEFKW